MAKRNLLLVDADPRSVRVLEVSLRKAGYSVTTSNSVDDALELVELTEPDMVVSDTQLEGKDGFEFVEALKANPQLCKIPFVFLSTDGAVESKVRGLELGADEYLTKPVYIREILTRIHLIFQRQEQEGALRTSKTRFAGSLADMGLVDLLQTIDVSRKSGVLHLNSGRRRGAVYFADGRLVDAELGDITGEAAVYRFLVWNEGEFEVDFRDVRREDRIQVSTQGILMEGMRRLDEWGRLQEQLPPMSTVFQVNHDELLQRLAEIPDEINEVFRLFDGERTLADVIDASPDDDLATMNAISKLYFEGFIVLGEHEAERLDREDDDGDVLVGGSEAPERADAAEPEALEADAMLEPRDSQADDSPGSPSTLQKGASPASQPLQESSTQNSEGSATHRRQNTQPLARVDLAPPEEGRLVGAASASGPSVGTGAGKNTARGLAPPGDPESEATTNDKTEAASPDSSHGAEQEAATPEEPAPLTPPEVSGESTAKKREDSNVIRFPSTGARRSDAPDPASEGDDSRSERDGSSEPPAPSDPEPSVVAEGAEVAEGGASPQPEVASTDASVEPTGSTEPIEPTFEDPPEDRFLRSSPPPAESRPMDAVETFFSTPVPPPHYHDSFADLSEPHQRQKHARQRAQGVAMAITIGAFLMLGGFLFYYRSTMSRPEPDAPVGVLPTPDLMEGIEMPDEEAAAAGDEVAAPVVEAPPVQGAEEAEEADEGTTVAQAEGAASEEESAPGPDAVAAPPSEGPDSDAVEDAYGSLLEEARRMGFRPDAEKVYRRALALKPDGDGALSGLGMWLLNRGKNKQALERATQAVAENPENSEGWIVLGAAHDALGHARQARDAYQQCAEQGKGKYVLECRRMLR